MASPSDSSARWATSSSGAQVCTRWTFSSAACRAASTTACLRSSRWERCARSPTSVSTSGSISPCAGPASSSSATSWSSRSSTWGTRPQSAGCPSGSCSSCTAGTGSTSRRASSQTLRRRNTRCGWRKKLPSSDLPRGVTPVLRSGCPALVPAQRVPLFVCVCVCVCVCAVLPPARDIYFLSGRRYTRLYVSTSFVYSSLCECVCSVWRINIRVYF
mmetsp:Transcript_34478/g.112489  ORF Transcript_34478/g.112489 Transcript_34478/m.112489 type:complete len:216 (-) Transcript_34478:3-650(-)